MSKFIFGSHYSGINSFESTTEMMKFVEECLSTDPYEISKSVTSPKEKYRTFFKLSSVLSQKQISDYKKSAYIMYNAIMRSQKLSVKFESLAAQRFLIHLVIHHCLVVRKNAFAGSSSNECTVFGESTSSDINSLNQNLDLITSYFNHSCLPNVVTLDKGNMTIIKAISTIKKGEQLFITYLDAFAMDDKEKRNQLENTYGFKCECRMCTKGIMNARWLENVPLFMDLDMNLKKLAAMKDDDINLIRYLKQLCVEFMSKYPNGFGSKEFAYVAETLGTLLQKELNVR